MSDFDNEMKSALGGGGFDPDRAREAQDAVLREYQKKLKISERAMCILLYVLCAAAVYALEGFMLFAISIRECVAYSMVVLWTIVIIIQKTILQKITVSQLAAMKEIKQMRLAMAMGSVPVPESIKPLRGMRRWESAAWTAGLLIVIVAASNAGARTDRQDDVWRIGPGNQVEAHQTLTLRRFPHEVYDLSSIKPPADRGVLKFATLNGKPVPFNTQGFDAATSTSTYQVHIPHRFSWTTDKVELVWSFSLPDMQDYAAYPVPLRTLVPVHTYWVSAYVRDDSGFAVKNDSWKFNKSPEELKNTAESRRTVKCFTISGSLPNSDFGSCGLSIVKR